MAPQDLTGWSVQYASAAGSGWQVTPLAGTLAPGGRYLVQQAQGAGGTTPLPTPDATGTIPMAAGSGKVALLDTTTVLSGAMPMTAGIRDLVGYGTAGFVEGTGAAPTLGNTTAAQRIGDGCTDTDDNAADFLVGAPDPQNSGGAGPGEPPAPTITPIHAIQGAGAVSPLVGRTVTVEGVVTGVDDEIGSSFTGTFPEDAGVFIQSLTPDADPATSEGVFIGFVRDRGAYPPGTVIRTTGQVREKFGFTIIAENIGLEPEIIGTAPLPGPVDIGTEAAYAQGDERAYYESLEGMRVRLPLGTANSGGTNKFGELFLTPGPRRERLFVGDAAPALLATDADAGAGDPDNPFRPAAPSTTLVRGDLFDRVADVVGPLAFSFGNYKVMVQPGLLPEVRTGPTAFPFRDAPRREAGEVSVASFNVENLLPVGAELDLTTVSPEEFTERITSLGVAIRTRLQRPDVVAVQEVGDLETLQALADEAGPYRAFLVEGNDERGIDVGYLVRNRAAVKVDGLRQLGKDAPNPTAATCSDVPGGLFDRPPLAIDIRAHGLRFTIINNHFSSKSAPDACRDAQAAFVRDRVREIEVAGGEALVVGDLNAFESESPLAVLEGASTSLDNLWDLVPAGEAYSFQFDGRLQTLDHILATDGLARGVRHMSYAHLGTHFHERTPAVDGHAASDHDPVVVVLGRAPGTGGRG